MELRGPTFRCSSPRSSVISRCWSPAFGRKSSSKLLCVKSDLPFSPQEAKYFRELQAAVHVVERACRICVNVQKSLFSKDDRIFKKIDSSPVTVADFGVQALVSLELGQMFPAIPLVAEEDSAFLRSNNLVDPVVSVVNESASSTDKPFGDIEVLNAIDRGGSIASNFGAEPATYWVLDPIDGTRGFLKGQNAFYVVGLALVVEGEVVLGVMGCPNWPENLATGSSAGTQNNSGTATKRGILMASHVDCGTWSISLSEILNGVISSTSWTKCFVDGCLLVHKAQYCIPESQTWDSIPLSDTLSATKEPSSVESNQVLLLRACCGSLCKYLMVATGRASVFILRARPQRSIKAWDHVAGLLCVHEAGGKVTDWKGSHLNFAADEAERRVIYPVGGVLVSNGNLHSEILNLISLDSSVV